MNSKAVIEELYRFIDTENKSLMVLLSRIVEIISEEGDFSNPIARRLMVNSLKQKSQNLTEALREMLKLIEKEFDSEGAYEETPYNPDEGAYGA